MLIIYKFWTFDRLLIDGGFITQIILEFLHIDFSSNFLGSNPIRGHFYWLLNDIGLTIQHNAMKDSKWAEE